MLPPRRRPPPRRTRNRRGATIVLVAILMVPLIGLTAFAVDLSYLYAIKSRLAVASNAAAHAGALKVAKAQNTAATAEAVAYGDVNPARAGVSPVSAVNVRPGMYDPAADPTFTPAADWTTPGVNAVQAVAVDDTPLFFAQIFNKVTARVIDTAVAAVGSATASGCIKPWAVPYRAMTAAAGRTDPNNLTDLTVDEVAYLANNRVELQFKIGSGDDPDIAAGNFNAVKLPVYRFANGTLNPVSPSSGANDYRYEISSNDCDDMVSVGDVLETQTGNMVGPTQQGMADLCGGNPSGGSCNNLRIVLPIWKDLPPKSGNTLVKIAYIGAFVLTRYDKAGKVFGYFSSFSAQGGGFTTEPGPITKVVITQ